MCIRDRYNAADKGEDVQISPDEMSAALKSQGELLANPEVDYSDPGIAIDDIDAALSAVFGFSAGGGGILREEIKPEVDILTRRETELEAFEEASLGVFGRPRVRPESIRNNAIQEVADQIDEIPCEPTEIEFVKVDYLSSGIRTNDLPDINRPKNTQGFVPDIPLPTFDESITNEAIIINENIGVPTNLFDLIRSGLSFEYPNEYRENINPVGTQDHVEGINKASRRAQERVRFIQEMLNDYEEEGNDVDIDTYLDVGCGTGEITEAIREALGINIAYPADIEPQTCVNFLRIGDNNQIDLSDDSVDLITAYVSMHHFSDFPMMISEIIRVIRPGKFLFIREHDADIDSQPYLDIFHMIEAISRGTVSYTHLRAHETVLD